MTLRRRGRDGRSEARTQGAPRLESLGATEDTASGRAARPGGTRLIVLEPLSPLGQAISAAGSMPARMISGFEGCPA